MKSTGKVSSLPPWGVSPQKEQPLKLLVQAIRISVSLRSSDLFADKWQVSVISHNVHFHCTNYSFLKYLNDLPAFRFGTYVDK